jgi:hypothetical protein
MGTVRAQVRYVRSIGSTTDQDLTARSQTLYEGSLRLPLREGVPLILTLPKGKELRTSPIQAIQSGTERHEVVTKRSVYQIRILWTLPDQDPVG